MSLSGLFIDIVFVAGFVFFVVRFVFFVVDLAFILVAIVILDRGREGNRCPYFGGRTSDQLLESMPNA